MVQKLEQFLDSIPQVNTFKEYIEELKKPSFVELSNGRLSQPYKQLSPYNNTEIVDIKETKKSLTIYIKEYTNGKPKRIPFDRINNTYVFDATDYHTPFKIEAKTYRDLFEQLSNIDMGLIRLMWVIDYRKSEQRKQKQKAKQAQVYKNLRNSLKQGDYVERIGKTPNLGNYIIQVDKVTDYGVSGFYMDLYTNGNMFRTCEYTTVSWRYIKGKYERDIS